MKLLKVERFGTEAQGIRLLGDPKIQPEPLHVRIVFPGGDVDVVRCDDGSYWVHVAVHDDDGNVGDVAGKLVDARLDIKGKDLRETSTGDFGHPGLYHLAVRVAASDTGAPEAGYECACSWVGSDPDERRSKGKGTAVLRTCPACWHHDRKRVGVTVRVRPVSP